MKSVGTINLGLNLKKGVKTLNPERIHIWHRRMIMLCLVDLYNSGVTYGHIDVTFQLGKSRKSDRLLGLCVCHRERYPYHQIYLYSYRRRVPTIMETIAHEFGHVKQHYLDPKLIDRNDNVTEGQANEYAQAMVKLIHRVPESAWSSPKFAYGLLGLRG